jgi:hypothetical protein
MNAEYEYQKEDPFTRYFTIVLLESNQKNWEVLKRINPKKYQYYQKVLGSDNEKHK